MAKVRNTAKEKRNGEKVRQEKNGRWTETEEETNKTKEKET